ncbi:MAG: hypothetical protein CM1200mP10_24900 [Candidatus Neomarinimicrobiota bacterium]|nr:MAG: hypothetical protein CM1200mP10_24900 [Candidatus Neomarinimicrobiota bacterium]
MRIYVRAKIFRTIYTNGPFNILRYEYQDLHIYAPVQLVNPMPEAYQVYIFDKDNEVDALFAATYMPEEKIEVYLPQNTLSTDKNGNIFVISPQGRDMPDIKIKFTGKRYGDITLPVTKIVKTPAIVEGSVFRRYETAHWEAFNWSPQIRQAENFTPNLVLMVIIGLNYQTNMVTGMMLLFRLVLDRYFQ